MPKKIQKKLAPPTEIIAGKIYLVRGQKVMLDRDLAELYGVETRVLNQAVTRNADRFPNDFMFPLSRTEIESISQIVTSSLIKFSKNVRAFTEQGVAMFTLLNAKFIYLGRSLFHRGGSSDAGGEKE